MKNLSIENIIAACHGEWRGKSEDLRKTVSAVTTDSRTVQPECLFAALKGENHDGHDFISYALDAGALCCLVERIPSGAESGNLILVPSVLTALQQIAAFYRRQLDVTVICITGSVGKTTAKDMVASVLSTHYRVHKTADNFNNDLGVPLSVFAIPEDSEISVLELGVSHPGDMDRIAAVAAPDIVLFTLIGDAHLEFFGDRQGVLAEKSRVLAFLPGNGTVILNGDDPLLCSLHCPQKVISFGTSSSCDIRLVSAEKNEEKELSFLVVSDKENRSVYQIHGTGVAETYAALEGISVGKLFQLSDAEISRGLLEFSPSGHRLKTLKSGSLRIIDDCYNANPTSVSASILSMPGQGRRVCILGDMLELGTRSPELHREIGAFAASCGVALLLTVGRYSKELAEGFPGALIFENVEALSDSLPDLIQKGDTILVKASHGMHFERILDTLCMIGTEL